MADQRKPSDGADVKNDDAVLEEALDLHKLCVDNEATNRQAFKDDVRFAVLEEQWDETVTKTRKEANRPYLTANRLKAFRNQVVNDARQNTPAIKVSPVDDEADPMTAEVFNGLIRNIEQISNADVAYDTGVQFAIDGGWGYWYVDIDYAHDDTFDQEILIKRVPNPLAVYGDPYSQEADSSDWNDAFFEDLIAKKVFERRFKGADPVDWTGYENLEQPWKDGDEILIAKWWHRDEVVRQIFLVQFPDGTESVIAADVFGQHKEEYKALGAKVVNQRDTKSYKITHRVLTGAEIVKKEEWIGRYIPVVPCYGEDVNVEGERHFRSLIRSAKDLQRLYNYCKSTEAELLSQAPRAPYIGPEDAFKGEFSDRWETANMGSWSFLGYKGQIAPQRQTMGASIQGFPEYALSLADDMKAVLGMFNASLGMAGNETSGRAIRERRQEGDTATFHFPDNLRRSIAHTGRILIDLIPKVYSGKRIVRLLGKDKKSVQTVPLGQRVMAKPTPGGMPEIRPMPPPAAGGAIPGMATGPDPAPVPSPELPKGFTLMTFDLSRGRYDLVAEAGPNFATKRQEAAEQMMELLRVFPQAAGVIGDLLAANLDWPQADEIAARLKSLLPPAALGQEDPRLQQAMQMIETLKQALEMAQQQVEAVKMDKQVDMAKIAVDEQKVATEKVKAQTAQFEAITDRMAVLKPEPQTVVRPNGAGQPRA